MWSESFKSVDLGAKTSLLGFWEEESHKTYILIGVDKDTLFFNLGNQAEIHVFWGNGKMSLAYDVVKKNIATTTSWI